MTSDLTWRPYERVPESTVVGDLRVSGPLSVPYFDRERELLAYLPPSYGESEATYPVIYMHDGRNLFDEAESNDGEWRVDETMERLASEGLEAIVVGIPNADDLRWVEYAPFVERAALSDERDNVFERQGPEGAAYVDWLLETVVPAVESRFRVSEDPADRGVFGSSMGGLISLYAFFREPDAFGYVGAMSPAAGGPWAEIIDFIESVGHVDGRIYVDVGGREFHEMDHTSEFVAGVRNVVETLESLGYDESLRYVYDPNAVHHEDEWAERFPEAVRFLLS